MEQHDLPCKLTKLELESASKDLVEEIHNRDVVEEERKVTATEFKDKLKAHDLEVSRLAKLIRAEEEVRPVDVDVRRNNEKGIMEFIRTDTGEVVDTREMTDEEQNTDLFADAEEAGEAESGSQEGN